MTKAKKQKPLTTKMREALDRICAHGSLRRRAGGFWVVPQAMDGNPMDGWSTRVQTLRALVARDLVVFTEYTDGRSPMPVRVELLNSFKVEVTTESDFGKFNSNALRFVTRKEAEEYGNDLFMRWMAVKEWRVVGSTDLVSQGRYNACADYSFFDLAVDAERMCPAGWTRPRGEPEGNKYIATAVDPSDGRRKARRLDGSWA